MLHTDQVMKAITCTKLRKFPGLVTPVDDNILHILYFPDVQVIVSEDEEDLRYMVKKLHQE